MADSPMKRKLIDSGETSSDNIENKKLCSENNTSEETEAMHKTLEPNNNRNVDTKLTKATEQDVGITEYISSYPGFHAVMKERYSDFLVNEIDLDGTVVRLTNMEMPVDSDNNTQIEDLVDEEVITELKSLQDLDEKKEVQIKVTDQEKNVRKLIHETIRKSFHGLESSTSDKDGEKFITVRKVDKKQKGRRFQPPSGGNYLHFVLYKENRDTMDAINTVSSYLRINPKVFSYAGTKDKRAKTSQFVSVYRLSPAKLLGINKKFNMIKVGNITNKKEQLKLGDLRGNKFTIILRQLKGEPELIEKAIQSLASEGFINYYGMQRFGTSSVTTHSIGRALLQSDWKSAVDLILKPRLEGDENMTSSRKIWAETNDAKKALENLRNKSSIEGKLFSGLATNNENDLVNALNAIPRNTRLMYIHSYQSYIWNKVLSKRIQKFGLNVLVGDLVSKNSGDSSDIVVGDNNKKMSFDIVSEENIDKLSIKDVLLPLPGHSVTYPNNEVKEFYETFLEEDGMNWGSFESKVKTYSLSGAYRKIIVTPSDVEWKILSYDDVSKPLALSDLDILQGELMDDFGKSGFLEALKLEFKLPSSSYATMAVREILKCSTSYSFR